jgi:predicted regulator of Ras-like GTPase activity (Roadblock/LC7/MglB family)
MPAAVCELVLTEHAGAEAQRACEELLRQSRARSVLLVGRDGSLLDRFGFTEGLDAQAAAALASACYSSTEALAELLGERGLRMFYQQGADLHFQIHRAGEAALMVVVFDERTNAGLVRMNAETAAERVRQALEARNDDPPGQAPDSAEPALAPRRRTASTRSRKRS